MTEDPRTDERASDPCPADVSRVDELGLAFKGSQLQTQIYVNARTEELNRSVAIELALPDDVRFEWRSPVADKSYAEYRDRHFLRAVDLEDHAGDLELFWPRQGPCWDALAVLRSAGFEGGRGVLLAEGKSYPDEMLSGTGAQGPSRDQIEAALLATQARLNLDVREPEIWLDRYYQLGNRLAFLMWLRREVGVEAWLVHLLFVQDPHMRTSEGEWKVAMTRAHDELGFVDGPPHCADVLLLARGRHELELPP